MSENLQLDIVTPDKTVVSRTVHYVGIPGIEGEFGVLQDHVPLLSALSIGDLYFRCEEKHDDPWHVFVSGGFVEVSGNKVTVLAEAAELAENIDVNRANKAKERAEARLAKEDSSTDVARAHLALHRAMSRLSIAKLA